MGGINCVWLAVWALSPDWLSRKQKVRVCDFCQTLRWSRRAWGREVRAVPRLCIVYTGICLANEGKLRKNLSQGIRKALGWPAPNATRLVDLAMPLRVIASTGLLAPAALGLRADWFI